MYYEKFIAQVLSFALLILRVHGSFRMHLSLSIDLLAFLLYHVRGIFFRKFMQLSVQHQFEKYFWNYSELLAHIHVGLLQCCELVLIKENIIRHYDSFYFVHLIFLQNFNQFPLHEVITWTLALCFGRFRTIILFLLKGMGINKKKKQKRGFRIRSSIIYS